MADYLHPSVSSRITDNSQTFVTAQGQTLLFAAFQAESGPDNVHQLITTESEFLFNYGSPNIRKYGQTAYNVTRWLNAGGSALCLRVLPYMEKDSADKPLQQSTYACYILEVGCDTANPGVLKHRVRELGDGRGALSADVEKNIRTDAALRSFVLAAPDDAEGDGFIYYPLAVLRGRDRGDKFNKYGLRFELTDSLDETYEHRLYQLSVFSNGVNSLETFLVSLYPDAVDTSGASMFIENILANYSNHIRCLFSEDNYDAIIEYLGVDPVDTKKIDILELQERDVAMTETLHSGMSISDESADLSPTPEIYRPLGGGSDGDWEGPNSVESLLYKAYSGTGDFEDTNGNNLYDTHFGDIHDKKRYPIDMMLDANLPLSVKVAMSNLAVTRGDVFSIVDTGFTGSAGQALKYRQEQLTLNTYFTAIFTQDLTLRDPYQGNDMRVTPTYFLAEKIPQNDIANGMQWPFVGPRRGSIAGFKNITWVPNATYREQLYKAKLNYIEQDVRLTRFNSQSTSQVVNSALSDIPHVRVLLRIRREVEALAEDYLFQFNDAQEWSALQTQVNDYMQGWVDNRALTSFSASVYASAYDISQRLVRIELSVVFNGFIERVAVDIVVNR